MIKILSFNTWNLNGDYTDRMKILDEHIQVLKPDVICLQEISLEPEALSPQTRLLGYTLKNYSSLYSSQGKWEDREEGLATFTNLPIVSFESLMLPDSDGDMQRRAQFAVLDAYGQKIIVGNTHLSYHLDTEAGRKRQCRSIMHHLRRLVDLHECPNIALAGDLNSIPGSEPLHEILSGDLGFSDPFAVVGLQSSRYSLPSESPYANPDLWPDRWIDYILLAGDLYAETASISLDGRNGQKFASDHVALEVQVEFRE